jgi:CoA:oxalate CoA-transferase
MFDSLASLIEGAALHYLADGTDPGPIGNAHYSITPFDTFRCADGQVVICAANEDLFRVLAGALAHPEWLERPEFRTNRDRTAHRELLKSEIEAVLATAPASHWLGLLSRTGVPCGPIGTVGEALACEQAVARQMVITAGGLAMPGNPMKTSLLPSDIRPQPAPDLDQHGAQIRAELQEGVARGKGDR